MIIRELTKAEAQAEMKAAGIASHEKALPYRGYAATLTDDGKRRRFIGHHPDGRYLLQELPSTIPAVPCGPSWHHGGADPEL